MSIKNNYQTVIMVMIAMGNKWLSKIVLEITKEEILTTEIIEDRIITIIEPIVEIIIDTNNKIINWDHADREDNMTIKTEQIMLKILGTTDNVDKLNKILIKSLKNKLLKARKYTSNLILVDIL